VGVRDVRGVRDSAFDFLQNPIRVLVPA
jgi:hypothetical protein